MVINEWMMIFILFCLTALLPISRGTEYTYFTSREGVECKADGEAPYRGVLKRLGCTENKVGKECQNDKFCEEGDICMCNTKCESWRCTKGERVSTVENNTTTLDPCLPNPCRNGGICVQENDTHRCECPTGRSGGDCQLCLPGMTGVNCTDDIDECESPTLCHQGNCTNTMGSFNCTCKPHWEGSRCDTKIETCKPKNPCENNGTCLYDATKKVGYDCVCHPGYTGDNCQNFSRCLTQPCKNNGHCVNDICICPSSHTGDTCETLVDLCNKTRCNNGGSCIKSNGTCKCLPDFEGDTCEFRKNTSVDPFKDCPNAACRILSNDKVCSLSCNTAACMFDGGDCIVYEKCPFDAMCKLAYGDGVCDPRCNVKQCGYDNFDCDTADDPYYVPGRLVMEVASDMATFNKKKKTFERQLSLLLNSHVTVVDVVEKKVKRKRRSVDNSTAESSLEVTLAMDNRKCEEQCFTSEQAANYLSLKNSRGELRLPVKMNSVRAGKGTAPKGDIGKLSPIWIAALVVVPFLILGTIYKAKRKTIISKLWRPEDQPQGQREPPVGKEGSELRNLKEEESPDMISPKRQKLDDQFGQTTPFLPFNPVYDHALHYAAAYGREGLTQQQINLVDVNQKDPSGRTALHLAVTVKRDMIFKLLISNRNINLDLQDDEGNTPLMDAVKMYHNDYVKELIQLGSRVSLTNKQGKTALHHAAMVDNQYAADLLLHHNAKVDAQDSQMRTPLHVAAYEDSCGTAQLLVSSFANKNAGDIDDITPLMLARRLGHHQMVTILSDGNLPYQIPSPTTSSPAEVSPQPYPDIRPKLPSNGHIITQVPIMQPQRNRKRKKTQQQQNKFFNAPLPTTEIIDRNRWWEETCLNDIPDWSSLLPQHQPFQNTLLTTLPFDTPSPCVGESELSPISESIPSIMTPPQSWGTSSPQSVGGDDVVS